MNMILEDLKVPVMEQKELSPETTDDFFCLLDHGDDTRSCTEDANGMSGFLGFIMDDTKEKIHRELKRGVEGNRRFNTSSLSEDNLLEQDDDDDDNGVNGDNDDNDGNNGNNDDGNNKGKLHMLLLKRSIGSRRLSSICTNSSEDVVCDSKIHDMKMNLHEEIKQRPSMHRLDVSSISQHLFEMQDTKSELHGKLLKPTICLGSPLKDTPVKERNSLKSKICFGSPLRDTPVKERNEKVVVDEEENKVKEELPETTKPVRVPLSRRRRFGTARSTGDLFKLESSSSSSSKSTPRRGVRNSSRDDEKLDTTTSTTRSTGDLSELEGSSSSSSKSTRRGGRNSSRDDEKPDTTTSTTSSTGDLSTVLRSSASSKLPRRVRNSSSRDEENLDTTSTTIATNTRSTRDTGALLKQVKERRERRGEGDRQAGLSSSKQTLPPSRGPRGKSSTHPVRRVESEPVLELPPSELLPGRKSSASGPRRVKSSAISSDGVSRTNDIDIDNMLCCRLKNKNNQRAVGRGTRNDPLSDSSHHRRIPTRPSRVESWSISETRGKQDGGGESPCRQHNFVW
jgi:hypothetical protein